MVLLLSSYGRYSSASAYGKWGLWRVGDWRLAGALHFTCTVGSWGVLVRVPTHTSPSGPFGLGGSRSLVPRIALILILN